MTEQEQFERELAEVRKEMQQWSKGKRAAYRFAVTSGPYELEPICRRNDERET